MFEFQYIIAYRGDDWQWYVNGEAICEHNPEAEQQFLNAMGLQGWTIRHYSNDDKIIFMRQRVMTPQEEPSAKSSPFLGVNDEDYKKLYGE